MAEYDLRFEDNVDGRFYVDDECINCDLCSERAPEFFRESDEGGFHFVFQQPTSESEIELALEALEECPAMSIGDDGLTCQNTVMA